MDKPNQTVPAMVVCMPRLSVVGLMMIWGRQRRAVALVVYGKLPLYLTALVRIVRLPEPRLIAFLALFSGFSIEKIRHEEKVPNYPASNMRAMEAVVPATLGLEAELRRSRWTILAGRLIGKEEAVALALQTIAHQWIWPQVLQIVVSAAALRPGQWLYIIPSIGWPGNWNGALQGAIPKIKSGFFEWPRWHAGVYRFFRASYVITSAFASVMIVGLGRRFRGKNNDHQKARLLCEFIDPVHVHGTPKDVDYLVDGERIRPADFLLFVTREQAKIMAANGWKRSAVANAVGEKGYKLVWIDELPFRIADIKAALSVSLGSFACVFAPLPTVDVFSAVWKGFLRFAPLFNQVNAEACLYLKFPNGTADWRRDTAILTGLCRRAGIVSAGCQTRAVYGPLYEFAFDCYDIHLNWGSVWYRSLQPALRHITKMVNVGCPALDILLPARNKTASEQMGAARRVLVFTGDVAGSHYTFDYNISFLDACLMLACMHRDVLFLVKTKDPVHVDRFLGSDRLSERLGQCPHFEFVKRPRHDYAELLASADIVIAIGFTTPGTEALLLGKAAIYYSELCSGGEAYRSNPRWVARNPEELRVSFDACLEGNLGEPDKLDELEPFRDGRSRERILTALFGC